MTGCNSLFWAQHYSSHLQSMRPLCVAYLALTLAELFVHGECQRNLCLLKIHCDHTLLIKGYTARVSDPAESAVLTKIQLYFFPLTGSAWGKKRAPGSERWSASALAGHAGSHISNLIITKLSQCYDSHFPDQIHSGHSHLLENKLCKTLYLSTLTCLWFPMQPAHCIPWYLSHSCHTLLISNKTSWITRVIRCN